MVRSCGFSCTEIRSSKQSEPSRRSNWKKRHVVISFRGSGNFITVEIPPEEDPQLFWTKQSLLYACVMFKTLDGGHNWIVEKQYGICSQILQSQAEYLPKPSTMVTDTVQVTYPASMYYGFKHKGNCITQVVKDSKTDKANIKAGWFIVEINGEKQTSWHDEIKENLQKAKNQGEKVDIIFSSQVIDYDVGQRVRVREDDGPWYYGTVRKGGFVPHVQLAGEPHAFVWDHVESVQLASYHSIVQQSQFSHRREVHMDNKNALEEYLATSLILHQISSLTTQGKKDTSMLGKIVQTYNNFRWKLEENIVGTSWFSNLFLFFILINTIMVTVESGIDLANSTKDILLYIEFAFVLIFTAEMFLKLVIQHLDFFKDGWNLFDAGVVLASLSVFSGAANLGAMRSIRVLRPLRSIGRLPGLKNLIDALIWSFGEMVDVCLLLVLLLSIFAIFGLHLWCGALHHGCYDENLSRIGNERCSSFTYFGGRLCENQTQCQLNDTISNPVNGLIGFDNFGIALLTVFTIATREDWAPIMYVLTDAWGQCWFFFVIIILSVSFFTMTLVIGIMFDQILEATLRPSPMIDDTKMSTYLAFSPGASPLASIRRFSKKASPSIINSLSIRTTRKKASPSSRYRNRTRSSSSSNIIQDDGRRGSIVAEKRIAEHTRRGSIVDLLRYRSTDIFGSPEEKQKIKVEKSGKYEKIIIEIIRKSCVDLQHDIQSQRLYFKKYPCFKKVFILVEANWFSYIILSTIMINTIILGLDFHEMPQILIEIQEMSNYVFIIIFSIEMILKLAAYGICKYLTDVTNVFDCFIVFTSLVEIVTAQKQLGLTAFRTFRIFRVFKLFTTTSFGRLLLLLKIIWDGLVRVGYMALLLLLVVLVFGVTGVSVFSDLDMKRPNCDTLWWSLNTMFQVITGDQWIYIMGEAKRIRGWTGGALILAVYIIGGFIGVNMFVAIVLLGFSEDKEREEMDRIKIIQKLAIDRTNILLNGTSFDFESYSNSMLKYWKVLNNERQAQFDKEKAEFQRIMKKKKHTKPPGVALSCLLPTNRFRLYVFNFVNHDIFEWGMLISVLGSCITLAFETPHNDASMKSLLNYLNWVWTIIFSLELSAQVMAFGFMRGQDAYLSDTWNRLDTLIVIFSWLSLITAVPALGVLRAFRPLRLISRTERGKVVVNSMLLAFEDISVVMLFSGIIFFVFAILFISLFKGQFSYCDCEILGRDPCEDLSKIQCEGKGYWILPYANFDSIGPAMVTLVEVATFSNWAKIMFQAVDSSGINQGKIVLNRSWAPVPFCMFLIVCGFFVLNLFVGIIVDHFHKLKKRCDGSAFLTQDQRDQKLILQVIKAVALKPRIIIPKNPIRAVCARIISSVLFRWLVILVILLDAFTLATHHYKQSKNWDIIASFNIYFLCFFSFEVLLRVTGLGFKGYWKQNWNRFDFLVTIVSILGSIGPYHFPVLSIGRTFRLIGQIKRLKGLFDTFIDTLPLMQNVLMLILIVMYVYTIMGVTLFANVKIVAEQGLFSRHFNFKSFFPSMMTLFRILTSDDWHELRWGANIKEPNCNPKLNECGVGWAADIYFISFMLFGTLIMTELYTAVILENFTLRGGGKDNFFLNVIQTVSESWGKVDHQSHEILSIADFLQAMHNVDKPFGFKGIENNIPIIKTLRWSNIQCRKLINPYSEKKQKTWCVEYKPAIKRITRIAELDKFITLEMETEKTNSKDTTPIYQVYAVRVIEQWYIRRKAIEKYYLRRWFAALLIQTTWRKKGKRISGT